MSDFEKLINASDLIEWIMETYPDWCVGAVRSIVDHVEETPSAQPTYTELSPYDVALELSPEDMDGALSWCSIITRLIQTGYVICRKENRWMI